MREYNPEEDFRNKLLEFNRSTKDFSDYLRFIYGSYAAIRFGLTSRDTEKIIREVLNNKIVDDEVPM
mgnify:CR=1 FL=1